jgi:hypothetical protein
MGMKQFKESIDALKKAIVREPTIIYAHITLAGIYIYLGMEKEALKEVAEVYKLDPQFSLSKVSFPHKNPEVVEEFFSSLRKAGFK